MALENQESNKVVDAASADERNSASEALLAASMGASSAASSMKDASDSQTMSRSATIGESIGKAAVQGAGEALGKAMIQNGKEHIMGIRTTYDENGNATSDCFGPLPRPYEKPWPGNRIGDKDLDDLKNKIGDIFKKRDGVEKLSTGDFIVREDGKQTLFTPNGDSIVINPNGTHTIKGDVNKVSTGKNGETSVEFADGSKVSFDKEGFTSIQRDGQGISFGRFHPHPLPPRPWPPILHHGGGGVLHHDGTIGGGGYKHGEIINKAIPGEAKEMKWNKQ